MSWWQHPNAERVIEHYQALSQREKLLALITIHVVLFFLFLLLGW